MQTIIITKNIRQGTEKNSFQPLLSSRFFTSDKRLGYDYDYKVDPRTLNKNELVQLIGFGTFSERQCKVQKGINPVTKTLIYILGKGYDCIKCFKKEGVD